MNQVFKGNRFVYPCKHTRKQGFFCCPICHPPLSQNEYLIKRIKIITNQLHNFNLDFGDQLNDGLEDRIDQLINLLDKQKGELN